MIFRKFSRIAERACEITIAVVIVTLWFSGGPEYGISLDGVPPVVGRATLTNAIGSRACSGSLPDERPSADTKV